MREMWINVPPHGDVPRVLTTPSFVAALAITGIGVLPGHRDVFRRTPRRHPPPSAADPSPRFWSLPVSSNDLGGGSCGQPQRWAPRQPTVARLARWRPSGRRSRTPAGRSRSASSSASRCTGPVASTCARMRGGPGAAAGISSRRPRWGRCSGRCWRATSTPSGTRSTGPTPSPWSTPAPDPARWRVRCSRRHLRAPRRCVTSPSRSPPRSAAATHPAWSRGPSCPTLRSQA